MSQQPSKAQTFFNRESSWTLSHGARDSHLVLFSTQNGLALAVLVFMNGGALTTKHFPAESTDEAKSAAIDWAKENIDSSLSVSEVS